MTEDETRQRLASIRNPETRQRMLNIVNRGRMSRVYLGCFRARRKAVSELGRTLKEVGGNLPENERETITAEQRQMVGSLARMAWNATQTA